MNSITKGHQPSLIALITMSFGLIFLPCISVSKQAATDTDRFPRRIKSQIDLRQILPDSRDFKYRSGDSFVLALTPSPCDSNCLDEVDSFAQQFGRMNAEHPTMRAFVLLTPENALSERARSFQLSSGMALNPVSTDVLFFVRDQVESMDSAVRRAPSKLPVGRLSLLLFDTQGFYFPGHWTVERSALNDLFRYLLFLNDEKQV